MNIRKKPLNRRMEEGNVMGRYKEPEKWTIITALNRVLDAAQDCMLSEEYWEECKNPLAFLRQELGLTNVQIVVLAIMVEAGDVVSWSHIANYLGCSRLTVMVYSEEIEELVTKRWAIRKEARDFGLSQEGFVLAQGVITALRCNKVFVPE